MLGKALTTAAAGSAAGAAGGLGIEDVFSTWLYTGNSSTQTITNGIDLSGEGGLVWIKKRDGVDNHVLVDTARGSDKLLRSNSTAAETTSTNAISSFNSDGFSLNSGVWGSNSSGADIASWTFRKAPGFFDVVTYTGTGSAQNISHNLGSVPGCIIVKRTDASTPWAVAHRGTSNYSSGTDGLNLDTGDALYTSVGSWWNSTGPTSSQFTVGNAGETNVSGGTYVAYLFAHDEQIFGESGSESVIKCGSFTTDGSGNATVNLGWEPQWFLMKRTDTSESWTLLDTMRGFTLSNEQILRPNTSSSESNSSGYGYPTATGWSNVGDNSLFYSSADYIYIAIRRGPMKTPTDATDVFTTTTQGSAGDSLPPAFRSTHLVDWVFSRYSNYSGSWDVFSRLTGTERMYFNLTNAGASGGSSYAWDYQNGFWDNSGTGSTLYGWMFRRAPGFFDVVTYTGDGSNLDVDHNLGAVPEMMIVRQRNNANSWIIYHKDMGNTKYLIFSDAVENTNTSIWNSTTPTSTSFRVGGLSVVNGFLQKYIAYLFGTVSGVSKVGSYTGTASTLNVDCGFSAGARFVLIKRTDSTGDWYVWDTARGIVSGNDPYLLLNSTAAEVTNTDYIDPYSAGFTISSSAPAAINASGGSFIFLAIA